MEMRVFREFRVLSFREAVEADCGEIGGREVYVWWIHQLYFWSYIDVEINNDETNKPVL
jgi:hypothetical protein